MLLVWSIAWTIFSMNPLATYAAERTVAEQADIQTRLAASRALPFSL
ncbi:MAG: hypothetical protein SGJ23_07450 [Alphaproteobacteria bacterium]|nr:hypothetical protein [Alphaproteobacteria bacterium]